MTKRTGRLFLQKDACRFSSFPFLFSAASHIAVLRTVAILDKKIFDFFSLASRLKIFLIYKALPDVLYIGNA